MDIDETMTAKEGLESVTSGATAKSLSAPQLTPIFSYPYTGGGDIFVYIVKTEVSTIAIATFDDTSTEFAYAVQTLATGSNYEVYKLIKDAEERFNDNENNPFTQLLWDIQALSELYNTVDLLKGE